MSDQNAILYAAPEPYPPIRVERPNPRYAQMLQANFASAGSELTSITQYTYHSLVLGRSAPEAADALHHISITEMHHLDIFGRLVLAARRRPALLLPAAGLPGGLERQYGDLPRLPLRGGPKRHLPRAGRHPHLPVPGGGDRGLLYLRDAQPASSSTNSSTSAPSGGFSKAAADPLAFSGGCAIIFPESPSEGGTAWSALTAKNASRAKAPTACTAARPSPPPPGRTPLRCAPASSAGGRCPRAASPTCATPACAGKRRDGRPARARAAPRL